MKKTKLSKRAKTIISIEIIAIMVMTMVFYVAMNTPVERSSANNNEIKKADIPFTILIDPGHGGIDPGAVNKKYNIHEKDLNLEISKKLGDLLESNNIRVLYTREDDNVPWVTQMESLRKRVEIESYVKPDIFVSIHINSSKKPTSTGFEVWCTTKNSESEILGYQITNEIKKIRYTEDRGLKYKEDNDLYVINRVDSTAVLVELGFLSNYEDLAFLLSEEGKNQCAEGIATGLINYYNSYYYNRK